MDAIPLPPSDPGERRHTLIETLVVMAAFHTYMLLWRPTLAVDIVAVGGFAVAVFAILARRRETWASIAFVGDVRGASRLAAPVAAAIVLGAAAIRLACGPLRPTGGLPGLVLALLAYPIWGFAQQLFYLGFCWRGLVQAGIPPCAAGVVSGLAFGLIHAPNWLLVAATLPFGLICAAIYRRAPSLLVLGLLHGIGGVLAMRLLGLDLEIGAGFIRPH